MVFDLADERHPTLFKGVQFYIWPTRWAKPSKELALFIRRKGGKCYDWHASDLKHHELVARAKAPGLVLVDPTEEDSPELLSKREEGDLRFISWAYPHLCFQSGEVLNLNKAAKQLLFVRMCDGTRYSFHFDYDRTSPRELRQIGELRIQFMNRGGKVVEHSDGADAIITTKGGDALQDLRAQYSFATETRVETLDWLKDCLNGSSWRFSPPSRKPLGGRPPGRKTTYTQEEDALLVKYLAEHTRTEEGRQGCNLYKDLVALGENNASYSWVKRHSWKSWRNHYIKQPRKKVFDNLIRRYQKRNPRAQTDGYGTYFYTRDMNKRKMVRPVRLIERETEETEEEEVDELESDSDAELQQTEQVDKKGEEGESESEEEHGFKEQSRQRHRHRDLYVPQEVRQEDEADLNVPLDYEDDGANTYSEQDGVNFVGEERPVSQPSAPVKAKRQREDVDAERERQRKRRKTELTQATLVNPSQYNPFRDSPLSKAAASEHAPSRGFGTPTRLPMFDFSKHNKRIPVRSLPVMDFTDKAKRRESIAQRVADQTFVLEHEEEEAEAVISSKDEDSHLSRSHQEEDFGEVAELQVPKRQRKSKLNPDLIPAMTYQTVRTGVKTRSQYRAETPRSDVHVSTRTSNRSTGRIGSRRRGNTQN